MTDFKLPASLRDPKFRFDPEWHTYHYGRRKLKSVTRALNRFKKPFDADHHAERKAKQLDLTPEEVKAKWRAKGDAARELGTEVHYLIEAHLNEAPLPTGLSEEAHRRYELFVELWEGRLKEAEVLATELRLFSLELGIGGTLDTLIRLPNEQLLVGDWKTNNDFKSGEDGWEPLLEPFDDLMANEENSYGLQVSLYRVMLEEHGLETHGSFLAHLGPEAQEAVVYFPRDLRDRLREALRPRGAGKKLF